MPKREKWNEPFKKALTIAIYIFCHALVAVCLIVSIEVIAWVLAKTGEPKLFDVIPLRYCFDAMELVILLTFAFWAVVAAGKWFRIK